MYIYIYTHIYQLLVIYDRFQYMTVSPQYLGIYVILPRIANGPMKMGLFILVLPPNCMEFHWVNLGTGQFDGLKFRFCRPFGEADGGICDTLLDMYMYVYIYIHIHCKFIYKYKYIYNIIYIYTYTYNIYIHNIYIYT